jgi:hypothetical protein
VIKYILPLLLLLSSCTEPHPNIICFPSYLSEMECVIEARPGRTICFTIHVECEVGWYDIDHCHRQDSNIDVVYFPLWCSPTEWEIRSP